MQMLADNLLHPPSRRALLEALRGLQRRALIEPQSTGSTPGFILQNVITEYLTDRLVETAVQELTTGHLDHLHRQALLKAQAKEYVRQSQIRLIMAPIARQLIANLGLDALDATFRGLLDALRGEERGKPSYAGGNILNLLLHLEINVRGFDFSQINIWQAYLQDKHLYSVNFAGSDLTQSVFSDTFDEVGAVAISPDGQIVAAGINSGDIRLWQVANGQPIDVIPAHATTLRTLAFSWPAEVLITRCGYGTLTPGILFTRCRDILTLFCLLPFLLIAKLWSAVAPTVPCVYGTLRRGSVSMFFKDIAIGSTVSPLPPVDRSWPAAVPIKRCDCGMYKPNRFAPFCKDTRLVS